VADDGVEVGRAWHWLSGNLAVVAFLLGILTGTAGGLFAAGRLVSDAEHRLVDLERQASGFHADLVSVDARLNALRDQLEALHRDLDRAEAQIAVTETRVQLLGDRPAGRPK
jgi:chromosome segregation ATPase